MPQGSADSKVIKVIDIRSRVIDVSTIDEESLKIVFDDVVESGIDDRISDAFPEIMEIAKIFRSPHMQFVNAQNSNQLDSVRVRMLLLNTMIHPIVSDIGARALRERATSQTAVYTQPINSIAAYNADLKAISIAAGDPILVIGFVVDTHEYNASPLLMTGYDHFQNLSRNTLWAAGVTTTSIISRMAKIRPVEHTCSTTSTGALRTMYFAENKSALIDELTQQSKSVLNYYLSSTANIIAGIRSTKQSAPAPQYSILSGMVTLLPERSWRSKRVNTVLAELVKKFAENHLTSNIAWKHELTPINDIFRIGASFAYLHAITDGINSEHVAEFIDQIVDARVKHEALAKVNSEILATVNKARLYLILVEKKFGSAFLNKIIPFIRTAVNVQNLPGGSLARTITSIQVDDPSVITALISNTEKKVLELEYKNTISTWDAQYSNTCDHVGALHKINTATTSRAAFAALPALDAFSEEPVKPMAWRTCKNCRFNTICPHVCERIELESKHATYDEIRTALMKYAIRDTTLKSATYYCSVCSEKLADVERDDQKTIKTTHDVNSDTRTRIWATSINSIKNLKFKIPVNEQSMANAMTDIISPFITANTTADNVMSATDELGIVIYVYAHILDIIQNNENVDFANVRPGSKLKIYATQLIKTIFRTHNGLIMRIPAATSDYINTRFIEAYHVLRGSGEDIIRAVKPEADLVTQTVEFDPIYWYAASTMSTTGMIPKNLSAIERARHVFLTVMGNSPIDIIKSSKLYESNLELRFLYQNKTGVTIPAAFDLRYAIRDPRVNLYANMMNLPTMFESDVAAFNALATKRGGRKSPKLPNKYESERQGEVIEAYRLFRMYTRDLHTKDATDKYFAQLATYRKSERVLKRLLGAQSIFMRIYAPYKPPAAYDDAPITTLFDEHGIHHDWVHTVIHIYDHHGKLIEVPNGRAGTTRARKEGVIDSTSTFVDFKCAACGVRRSQISTIDVKKTTQAVNSIMKIRSFFKFYESRCPVDGVHEWDEHGSCTKCALRLSIFATPDGVLSPSAREYSITYNDKLVEARTVMNRDSARAPAIQSVVLEEKAYPDVAKWSYDYTKIVDAAKLIDVHPNIIEAIGNMDNREYDDVVSGTNIPPMPTQISDARILAVDAEVRSLLTNYNALRFNVIRNNSPVWISSIFDGDPIIDLRSELPMVDENYSELIQVFIKTQSPQNAFKYALQRLCEIILAISKLKSKYGHRFAVHELNAIIRGQKRFCKPGSFSFSVFNEVETFDHGEELDDGMDKIKRGIFSED